MRPLDVPPVRLSTIDSRTFQATGTTVWNDLPTHVTSPPSLAIFRQRLKTFPVFLALIVTLSFDLLIRPTCLLHLR